MFRKWRERRNCFHHNNHTNESYVGRGTIIDWRKRYSCYSCGKVWII